MSRPLPRTWDKEVREFVAGMVQDGWAVSVTKRGHGTARHPSGATVGLSGGNNPNRNFANLKASVRRIERAAAEAANQTAPEAEEPVNETQAPATEPVKTPIYIQRADPYVDGTVLASPSPATERWTYPDGQVELHCTVCGAKQASVTSGTGHYAIHARRGETQATSATEQRAIATRMPVEQTEPRTPRATWKGAPTKAQMTARARPVSEPAQAARAPKADPAPAPTPVNGSTPAASGSTFSEVLTMIQELVNPELIAERDALRSRIAELEAELARVRGAMAALADLTRDTLADL